MNHVRTPQGPKYTDVAAMGMHLSDPLLLGA